MVKFEVLFTTFHQALFVPTIGHLGTSLSSTDLRQNKVTFTKLSMFWVDGGLLIEGTTAKGKTSIVVPQANVVCAEVRKIEEPAKPQTRQ